MHYILDKLHYSIDIFYICMTLNFILSNPRPH